MLSRLPPFACLAQRTLQDVSLEARCPRPAGQFLSHPYTDHCRTGRREPVVHFSEKGDLGPQLYKSPTINP